MKLSLLVNDDDLTLSEIDGNTPLLWVLRDELQLVGAKYGCGIGQCGACTVLVNDKPIKSCLYPVASFAGKAITTIEGLASAEGQLHPVQEAWVNIDVPQCGYCQAGQIISAYALLKENSAPTDNDIDQALEGNLCRCGTYPRIRKAIHSAAQSMSKEGGKA